MFSYILTLLVDPHIVDSVVVPLMSSFGLSEEAIQFYTEDYLPLIRNTTDGISLGEEDRISVATNTMATVGKLLVAFFWQEGVFDLGGINLTPEANQMGTQLLPVLNEYANNYTSWNLLVEDVQLARGSPGSEWCNNNIPHAKWHLQTAASSQMSVC